MPKTKPRPEHEPVLESVSLRIVTDVGAVTIEWNDRASRFALLDPKTPARTVREVVVDVMEKLDKAVRDER